MIRIDNATGLRVSIHDIRQAHPNISIPDQADLTDLGYPELRLSAPPACGRWQGLRELPDTKINGVWMQRFEVYDLPLSLDDKKAEVKRQADEIARQKRDMIVAGISPAEMSAWPIKRAEALAYQASGTEADAANLVLEATERGVPLAALAEKVLLKANQLAALEAAIAGRCGAIQDAAAAAQSEADLLAIDLDAGWPL